jgi:hypothetical protein
VPPKTRIYSWIQKLINQLGKELKAYSTVIRDIYYIVLTILIAYMSRTELKFPSIIELVDFSLAMKAKTYTVNRIKASIVAEFSQEDIDHAIKAYHAVVISTQLK